MNEDSVGEKSVGVRMKNRGRWDAGFRPPFSGCDIYIYILNIYIYIKYIYIHIYISIYTFQFKRNLTGNLVRKG